MIPTNLPSVSSGQGGRIADTNQAWSAINEVTALLGGAVADADDVDILLKGQTGVTRNVYVSPSGSDSNNGQTVGTPFLTFQKAFDYLASQGPVLQGQWYVNAAAGTYTISATQQTMKTPSINSVVVRGPAVSGGTPTAIISGSGGGDYSHGLSARGSGVQVEFRDLKFINFNGDPSGTTRIGCLGEQGSVVTFTNCHATGATWCGLYAFSAARAYVTGGILDGCRSGFISNTVQTTVNGTTIQNSTQEGIWWSRGSQGHIDNCTIQDNVVGVVIGENSRVDMVSNTFKRNGTAVATRTGGVWFPNGNTYGSGADVNTAEFVNAAGSGNASELAAASSEIRVGYDSTARTHTGTTSETTLTTVYTIPVNRLRGDDKQCRVNIKGAFTSVTSGSTIKVEIGGNALSLAVPTTVSGSGFEVEVTLLRTSGAWRTWGRMVLSANQVRTGTVSGGFTDTSSQAIVIKSTLANAADSLTICRSDVYITG